jgi:plastocyanin
MLVPMRGSIQKLISLSALLFISFTAQVRANEVIYWDTDFGFDPDSVIISPGDKVTWYNIDVFSVQIWVEGFAPFTLGSGQGVYAIFNTPGVYSMDSNYGDTGTIVVDIPPTVTITNPVNNAVFSAPATFEIKTSASSDSLSVTFMLDSGLGQGEQFLDFDSEAPFTSGLTNLEVGTYTLRAIANDGYSEASDTISFTVNEAVIVPVITLSNPRVSGAQFLFDANGLTPGKTHVLQDSTNCIAWTSIATNVAAASTRTFTNSTSASRRFYRVFQVQGP